MRFWQNMTRSFLVQLDIRVFRTTFPSMFEPIHGSAPDIAGQQIANPLAAIWSASQLLDFFGHEDLGKRILDTMEVMLTEHRDKLTPDQGGNAKTSECGDAFVELLRK